MRSRNRRDEQGFTLIELIVVMIVIGVLAAIAVPTFVGQKRKAYETSAKSDVKAIVKEVVAFYVDGSGGLTLVAGGAPGTWELRSGAVTVAGGNLSKGNSIGNQAISNDSSYCVAVRPSYPGAKTWKANESGLSVDDC